MKRKAFKRERRRVQRLFGEWCTQLGLNWWDVQCSYFDKSKPFKRQHGTVAAMTIVADWRYGTAYISVNTPGCARLDDDELERVVVHELVHALVNEMRLTGLDHEERVVTTLTKAFMWTRNITRNGRNQDEKR